MGQLRENRAVRVAAAAAFVLMTITTPVPLVYAEEYGGDYAYEPPEIAYEEPATSAGEIPVEESYSGYTDDYTEGMMPGALAPAEEEPSSAESPVPAEEPESGAGENNEPVTPVNPPQNNPVPTPSYPGPMPSGPPPETPPQVAQNYVPPGMTSVICGQFTIMGSGPGATATRGCSGYEGSAASGSVLSASYMETYTKDASNSWAFAGRGGMMTVWKKITSSGTYTNQYERVVSGGLTISHSAGNQPEPVYQDFKVWEKGSSGASPGTTTGIDGYFEISGFNPPKHYSDIPVNTADLQYVIDNFLGKAKGNKTTTTSTTVTHGDGVTRITASGFDQYILDGGSGTHTVSNSTVSYMGGGTIPYYPSNSTYNTTVENIQASSAVPPVYSWALNETFRTTVSSSYDTVSAKVYVSNENVSQTSVSAGSSYTRNSNYNVDGLMTSLDASFNCSTCAVTSRTISAAWSWVTISGIPNNYGVPYYQTWMLTSGSIDGVDFFQGRENSNRYYIGTIFPNYNFDSWHFR